MSINIYSSTDAGAPVLSGSIGAIIAVLDACLVNGYGSKAAAGWAIAYTGTNQRSYINGRSGTPRAYLYINDTTASMDATMRVYSIMNSAMDSYLQGTNTGNQVPSPLYTSNIPKSITTDATHRKWILFSDAYTFYLLIDPGSNGLRPIGAGEFYSYRSLDINNWFCAPQALSANSIPINLFGTLEGMSATTSTPNIILARGYSGFGGCVNTIKGSNGLPQYITQPSSVDGSIIQSPIYLAEQGLPKNNLRGHLRGIFLPGASPIDGSTLPGSGFLATKTMEFYNQNSFDITGPWDTN